VGIERLVTRPDVEAGFLGDNFQHAFPATVGGIWDGVIRVVLGDVLGTKDNQSRDIYNGNQFIEQLTRSGSDGGRPNRDLFPGSSPVGQ
jgi:hypothetical protein